MHPVKIIQLGRNYARITGRHWTEAVKCLTPSIVNVIQPIFKCNKNKHSLWSSVLLQPSGLNREKVFISKTCWIASRSARWRFWPLRLRIRLVYLIPQVEVPGACLYGSILRQLHPNGCRMLNLRPCPTLRGRIPCRGGTRCVFLWKNTPPAGISSILRTHSRYSSKKEGPQCWLLSPLACREACSF
jgi:hypothetical protein